MKYKQQATTIGGEWTTAQTTRNRPQSWENDVKPVLIVGMAFGGLIGVCVVIAGHMAGVGLSLLPYGLFAAAALAAIVLLFGWAAGRGERLGAEVSVLSMPQREQAEPAKPVPRRERAPLRIVRHQDEKYESDASLEQVLKWSDALLKFARDAHEAPTFRDLRARGWSPDEAITGHWNDLIALGWARKLANGQRRVTRDPRTIETLLEDDAERFYALVGKQ